MSYFDKLNMTSGLSLKPELPFFKMFYHISVRKDDIGIHLEIKFAITYIDLVVWHE